MVEAIRVGVIGIGWGSSVHVPAFRSVPDYELVALCGRRPDHVAEVAERTGIGDTSTDWERFVQRDDLDLIAIASPVDLHAPMALAALAAGKHVLCEKPMALNAEQARAMVDAAEAAGVVNGVGFEQRWYPERLMLREHIAAGGLGEPYLIQVSTNNGAWHPSLTSPAAWKLRAGDGGGFINAMACHDIDLVRSLFGEPVAVAADTRARIPQRQMPDGSTVQVDAEDTCGIMLRLASGALAIVSGTALSAHGTGYRLEVGGQAGSAALEFGPTGLHGYLGQAGQSDRQPAMGSAREPRAGLAVDATHPMARVIRSTALMLEDWLPAFSGQPSSVATFRDGLRVQEIVDAARASSAGAGWVEVASH